MPVSSDQICLHLTYWWYLSSESSYRKYEKLPNIVIRACLNITEKCLCLISVARKMWLCLFTLQPITFKPLNSLSAIRYVLLTHWPRGKAPDCNARGPRFHSCLRQGFLWGFFCVFLFFVQITLVTKKLQFWQFLLQ